MCRHIGYIGIKSSLYSILLNHDHSLLEMAYKPKEMKEAILNADGFGFGWKNKTKTELYKSNLPIWNDQNLLSITKSIFSDLIIGNVRSATIQENLGYTNTHPFSLNNIFFSHNGYVKDFNLITKKKLLKYLDEDYLLKVKGNTDSEIIFLLLAQQINKTNDIKRSIRKVIKIIKKSFPGAMLNFLLAFHDSLGNLDLYATRYAFKLSAPSLYFLDEKTKGLIVSSEKLNKKKWKTLQNNELLKVSRNSIQIENIL